jgi:hypothetical protein
MEGGKLGLADYIAAFLGDKFGGIAGEVFRDATTAAQTFAQCPCNLWAEDRAEHVGEGFVPIRIETLCQLLQRTRQVGVAIDAQLAHWRAVRSSRERQLRKQTAEGGAQAKIGFAARIRRPDFQAIALHGDRQGQGRRLISHSAVRNQRELDASAIKFRQGDARFRIEREQAVQRDFERTAREGLQGIQWRCGRRHDPLYPVLGRGP